MMTIQRTILPVPAAAMDVYEFVVAYKRAHDGNSPTVRQIAAGIDRSYHSAVPAWLSDLERVGLVQLKRGGKSHRITAICVTGGRWLPPQSGATAPNNQEGSHDAA